MPAERAPSAIVGIGASAGGLEAFSTLLRNLPADTGMAFVLVQHLDPHSPSILPELLAVRTSMPVTQVADNPKVMPNHVYVIPPNSTMVISGGALHLSPREASERHMPIDTFFISLAEEKRHESIGVVLSGVASDGTLGLRAIKAEGGITFAQDDTATFDGMPHSAIHMGVVDSVLPPDRIAEELAAIARHPLQTSKSAKPVADEATMQKLFSVLRTSRGIDFSQYKQPTVQRRLARRMVLSKAADGEEYVDILRRTPAEVDALFDDLLINVTEFFRDPAVFDALKAAVFPAFLNERRTEGQPIRVWVPGCSTGEEVYSIAICLTEYLEESQRGDPVQIFGTDVSPAAIQKARLGIYAKDSVAPVSPERMRRFFTRIDSGYQISRAIREACVFSLQNVIRDPPLSRMDLISCQNLLIYLGSAMQRRVLSIFLYALQPKGCLVLGASETPAAVPDLFEALDRNNRIFCRKPTVPQPALDLPPPLASFPQLAIAPIPEGKSLKLPELRVSTETRPREPLPRPTSLKEAHSQIANLEEEIFSTRQFLQTAIEELRSANEEAQSSNEELQSSNEELQTAKEELQSSNEELFTLNAEAQSRNAELDVLNNDLINLLGNLNTAIVMVDSELRIRRFTPAAQRMLNLIESDVGRPISDLQPRIQLPNLGEILRHVMDTMEAWEQEVEDPDGRWYSLRVRPYRTVQNRIDGAVLQLPDVTDRRRAAETRYRRLFEGARDGILIIDAVTGEIADANPFAEHLLGYPRAELVGNKLWDAGPLKGLPQAQDLVGRVLEDKFVPPVDLSLTTRDGSRLQVEAVANAYDEGGRRVIQVSVRDVTERRRMERQLQHTQKLESLGLLAGGVAHDFNNLLTTIMGNASLTLSETEVPESARQHLAQIVRASERAATLTRQMLAYAGRGRLLMEPIDLNQVTGELAGLVGSSLPKTIELRLDLNSGLPCIEGDPGQIQQVLMNLMINGGEAIAEGRRGSVTVRTDVRDLSPRDLGEYLEGQPLPAGKYVVLEVVDTGSGMDEATKARIFDPFFTTKFAGRGLGLAAVLGIIRSHQGAIRVESQLGRGTAFHVIFPASDSLPEPRKSLGTPLRTGQGTVLVVDDEPPLRLVTKEALVRNGYQVILADNGAMAVEIFREKRAEISLVLLDKTMPVMGGDETLAELLAIDPEAKVLMMSGYELASALESAAGLRLAGFLQKPFTVDRLLEAIHEALASSRPERPNPSEP